MSPKTSICPHCNKEVKRIKHKDVAEGYKCLECDGNYILDAYGRPKKSMSDKGNVTIGFMALIAIIGICVYTCYPDDESKTADTTQEQSEAAPEQMKERTQAEMDTGYTRDFEEANDPAGESDNKQIKSKNIIGDWNYMNSRIMGGYRITGYHKLTIIRNGLGDYSYEIKTTTNDEMYGSSNTEYSSGNLKTEITNNEWYFSGGDYGKRGAYIVLSDDYYLEDYNPEYLMVKFAPNRGYDIIYER